MLKYNNVKIENSLGEKSELKLISICFKFLGMIYQDLTREDVKGLKNWSKGFSDPISIRSKYDFQTPNIENSQFV